MQINCRQISFSSLFLGFISFYYVVTNSCCWLHKNTLNLLRKSFSLKSLINTNLFNSQVSIFSYLHFKDFSPPPILTHGSYIHVRLADGAARNYLRFLSFCLPMTSIYARANDNRHHKRENAHSGERKKERGRKEAKRKNDQDSNQGLCHQSRAL